jgi:hypothetical protein
MPAVMHEILREICNVLKGRQHSEDLGIDGRIVLGRMLEKWDGKLLLGFIWLRIRTSDRLL